MSKEEININSKLNAEIKQIILDSLTKDYNLSPVEKSERIYSDIELRFRKIFTSSVYASQFKQDKQSDAVEFAEWIAKESGIEEIPRLSKFEKLHNAEFNWYSQRNRTYYGEQGKKCYFSTQELYKIFKDEQLKKK
jgi:hypothetical protein